MAIDESGLTKAHARKLNALRKSVGDKLGEEVFSKWLAQCVFSAKCTGESRRNVPPILVQMYRRFSLKVTAQSR